MKDFKLTDKWVSHFYHPPAFLVIIVACLFSLALSSCGSTDTNNETDIDNRFSIEILPSSENGTSVIVRETLEGFSFFATGQDPETGEQGFGIYLNNSEDFTVNSSQNGLFGYLAKQSGQPGTGTFELADINNDDTGFDTGEEFAFVIIRNSGSQQQSSFIIGESGSVNITRSDSERVEGSISATGVEMIIGSDGVTETPVTITGEFTASGVDLFLGSDFTPF